MKLRKWLVLAMVVALCVSALAGSAVALAEEEQTIIGVSWRSLREIPERDRACLFAAGLMRIPEFHDEVLSWPGDVISYPAEQN